MFASAYGRCLPGFDCQHAVLLLGALLPSARRSSAPAVVLRAVARVAAHASAGCALACPARASPRSLFIVGLYPARDATPLCGAFGSAWAIAYAPRAPVDAARGGRAGTGGLVVRSHAPGSSHAPPCPKRQRAALASVWLVREKLHCARSHCGSRDLGT